MMRILFFVHSLRRGGAERVLLEIALGLREKGHDIEVVSWLDVDEYREDRYLSVPRHFLINKKDYRWPWCIPGAAARFKAVVEKFHPDVIEIHTPTVTWVAAWANIDIPYIHVLQGYGAITRQGSIKDWGVGLFDRLANNRLNPGFIVPSSSMIEAGANHFVVDKRRFTVVPNGVDVVKFHPDQNVFDGTPTMMMLGTLCANKGQAWGIRSIELLLKSFKDAKLKIVGEGADRTMLEGLVKELGLEGKAEVMGRRKDAFDLMSKAHVFWHLSESEGLPMVVIEAMAFGVPVVGFDVRGTRDVVANGETGYLVPFGDIQAVAQRTAELLNNEALYRKLSLNARRRVEQHFSFETMVNGHENVLWLAAERGKR